MPLAKESKIANKASRTRSILDSITAGLWAIAGFSLLALIVAALLLKDMYSGVVTLLWWLETCRR